MPTCLSLMYLSHATSTYDQLVWPSHKQSIVHTSVPHHTPHKHWYRTCTRQKLMKYLKCTKQAQASIWISQWKTFRSETSLMCMHVLSCTNIDTSMESTTPLYFQHVLLSKKLCLTCSITNLLWLFITFVLNEQFLSLWVIRLPSRVLLSPFSNSSNKHRTLKQA